MGGGGNKFALFIGDFDLGKGAILGGIDAIDGVAHSDGIAQEHRLQEADLVVAERNRKD